jgi:hypothetical protein
MGRHHAQPDPFRAAPIFLAVRRRPSWLRLAAPAGLLLVVVGIALAVGDVAPLWWLFVGAGLILAPLGVVAESLREQTRRHRR